MKRHLIVIAVFVALGVAAHSQETEGEPAARMVRWSCWSWWGRTPVDFDSITESFKTKGDPLMPCRFAPQENGTGIEFNPDDGMGYILGGYAAMRYAHKQPSGDATVFDNTRTARARVTVLEDQRNAILIESETENGIINKYRWHAIERLSENVFRLQSASSHSNRPTLWRVGSPEDIALQEWRKCMESNKGKGFDAVPCLDPLSVTTTAAHEE